CKRAIAGSSPRSNRCADGAPVSMPTAVMRAFIAILILAAAGWLLLVREAAPDAWALPAAARVAIAAVAAAGAVLVLSRRRPGSVAAAAAFALLAACAALALAPMRMDPDRWRAREEARLRARFDAVRRTVSRLEAQARALALDARTRLGDSASPPSADD